jgi:hypothetical protein
MKTNVLVFAASLAALGASGAASPNSVDDDLEVVKKATSNRGSEGAAAEASPRSDAPGPRWFRVRVVEKGQKKATVKVNLPLFLVQAFGDDVPIPGCQGSPKGRSTTLGEVLRALDSGESLVEIEDEDATIRVWVE